MTEANEELARIICLNWTGYDPDTVVTLSRPDADNGVFVIVGAAPYWRKFVDVAQSVIDAGYVKLLDAAPEVADDVPAIPSQNDEWRERMGLA
jgi:hypothetical protein